MKTVICQIGTLAFDGHTFHKGDIFEISDEMAAHLIEHKLATEYIQPEVTEVPKPTEEPEPELYADRLLEDQPDNAAMVDLSALNVREVTDLVKSTENRDVLAGFLEQELAHDNRKTIIEALENKLATA